MIKMFTVIFAILSVAFNACNPEVDDPPRGRTGMLVFNAGEDFDSVMMNVHYYVPPGDPSKMDFQVVIHGAERNADEYIVPWAAKAREYGLVLIAPQFDSDYFSTRKFNEGNLLSSMGGINPPEKTSFSLIDRIFEFVQEELDLSFSRYNIYGHSAGAQFVHRLMQFYDSPYINKAVAANAGWYTFPDETINFPYGVRTITDDINSFRAEYYGKLLTILVGTADTLRTNSLRTTPQADAQGLNRFERGNNFFDSNQQWAVSGGHQFKWHLQHVQDVGHDHTLMSPAAADHLYGEQE
jgi:poly(3-hydroxybutyrate) depolymerase